MSRFIKAAAFAIAAMGAATLAAPSAEAHGWGHHHHGGWGHHHHHHHGGWGWGHRHRHFHYGHRYRYRPVVYGSYGYGGYCHWHRYVTIYGTIAARRVCHY